ncbi:hypothetical protein ACHAWF_017256, partial [Thalassiosira exigua]
PAGAFPRSGRRRDRRRRRRSRRLQLGTDVCSCAPRSYTFTLLLDRDCASSTLAASDESGIRNSNCRITDVSDGSGRGLSGGPSGGRSGGRSEWSWSGSLEGLDEDFDRLLAGGYDDYETANGKKGGERRKPKRRYRARRGRELGLPSDDGTYKDYEAPPVPSYVTSIQFVEFDASGELNVINEDDSYLNLSPDDYLTNGTTIAYDSVSKKLNASIMGTDEASDYVPGGVGLFVFGADENGTAIVRSRFVWEYRGGCDGVPKLAGETFGWIAFEEVEAADPAFCPAARAATPVPTVPLAAAPSPAPVAPAPITSAPVTTAPITTAPITPAPVTPAPITPAPMTSAPIAPAPIAPAPEPTDPPATEPPTAIAIGATLAPGASAVEATVAATASAAEAESTVAATAEGTVAATASSGETESTVAATESAAAATAGAAESTVAATGTAVETDATVAA